MADLYRMQVVPSKDIWHPDSARETIYKAITTADFFLLESFLSTPTVPEIVIDAAEPPPQQEMLVAPWEMLMLGVPQSHAPTMRSAERPDALPVSPNLLAPGWVPHDVAAGSSDHEEHEEGQLSPTSSVSNLSMDSERSDDGSDQSMAESDGLSPRSKRKYKRQRPERRDFATEADYDLAFLQWRQHRDRNNKAVRKSRSQGTHRCSREH